MHSLMTILAPTYRLPTPRHVHQNGNRQIYDFVQRHALNAFCLSSVDRCNSP